MRSCNYIFFNRKSNNSDILRYNSECNLRKLSFENSISDYLILFSGWPLVLTDSCKKSQLKNRSKYKTMITKTVYNKDSRDRTLHFEIIPNRKKSQTAA